MGLLQVGVDAAQTVLADQWREYFYCDSLDVNTLATKGKKRNSKNNHLGSDNFISIGSFVAVNVGQCMIIVEQGAIVDVAATPGEFVFDNSKEPSIFYGGVWQGIKDSFNEWKKRFTFGGEAAMDQRVYYFNTKDIIGNKYGTPNPVPFRVVDTNIGLDIDIAVACHGEYSYKLQDPILFYKNICGNIEADYTRDQIDSQLKSELLTALQPAFAAISEKGVRYSAVMAHTDDLADELNKVLSDKWAKVYGIVISTFGLSSLKASPEDEERIKKLQANAALKDPTMAAATLTAAQAQAMQDAAKNESAGPMMAFAGMNMATMAGGGNNAAALYQMGAQQPQAAPAPAPAPAAAPTPVANAWVCPNCGTSNTGKFCSECGAPKPAPAEWVCPNCGAKNTGKFCSECGTARPQ